MLKDSRAAGAHRPSSVRLPALGPVLACLGLLLLAAPASHATDPAWWSVRGAVNSASTPAPYAVANEGQLKQFTVCAVQELNADLAGGAGPTLNQLVSGWQSNYVPNNPIDFQAVNIGQLKQIASLIYGQLQPYGYAIPSWLSYNTSTQYDVANLGQLKTVFNFTVGADPDGSGLPEWWEEEYFGQIGLSAAALAPNGDGLTLLANYKQ